MSAMMKPDKRTELAGGGHQWRQSLRSPSPKRGHGSTHRVGFRSLPSSPTPSKSSGEPKKTWRSTSPQGYAGYKGLYHSEDPLRMSTNKSSTASSLKKSIGSSLTADLSMSGKLNKSASELATIEGDYIKNLQQQIYFLELEASYLREQARKATEMHPQMVLEAETMLAKLKEMQSEMEKMEFELKRRDSSIGLHATEKDRLADVLQLEKENRQKDKRLMSEELVTLKKEKDRLERDLAHKNEQLLNFKADLEKSALALKNAELKISTLKAQMEQRVEQHNLTQLALEEKRASLLAAETQLRDMEEKYVSSTITIRDKLTQDLREEIRLLHQKVKESELAVGKDRFLRDKVQDEMGGLVRENSILNQKIIELSKQLDRERELRDSTSQRHSRSVAEILTLKERLHENDFLRDQLRQEQEKSRQYLEQLTNEGTSSKKIELQLNSLLARLKELEGMHSITESENTQLRKDKALLVDHVADLHRKAEDKEREVLTLMGRIDELGTRMKSTDLQKSLELTQQNHRWEEFARLADNMKSLSQSMMLQPSYNGVSPRRTAFQY